MSFQTRLWNRRSMGTIVRGKVLRVDGRVCHFRESEDKKTRIEGRGMECRWSPPRVEGRDGSSRVGCDSRESPASTGDDRTFGATVDGKFNDIRDCRLSPKN